MEIDWVKYFKCKKCWEVKPLNKCYFHINTMFSTGFNSKCKSCVKEEREGKPKVKYITRAELEEENKKLKERVSELEDVSKDYDLLSKDFIALWEENKKLQRELELVRKNTRANVETLDNMYWENVDLRKELEETKKDLEHRDSFFSIMRDVLANETITNDEIAMITYCVVHFECWDTDMSKKEVEIAEKFWFRDYV